MNPKISSSKRKENGTEIGSYVVIDRDGVKRWESEDGFEMFRFNVPGKSNLLLYYIIYVR